MLLRVFTTDVGAATFYGMGNRLKVDLKYQSPSRDWAGIEAWAMEVDLGIFPTVWRQKQGALLRACVCSEQTKHEGYSVHYELSPLLKK